jgi:hypothetical protein
MKDLRGIKKARSDDDRLLIDEPLVSSMGRIEEPKTII